MIGSKEVERYANEVPINQIFMKTYEHKIDALLLKSSSHLLDGDEIIRDLWEGGTTELPPNHDQLCKILDKYKNGWKHVYAFVVIDHGVEKITLMFTKKEVMKENPSTYIKHLCVFDKVYIMYPYSDTDYDWLTYRIYTEYGVNHIKVLHRRDLIYTHDKASQILDEFDKILSDNNIKVPSGDDSEREDDNAAALYGDVYDHLLNYTESVIINTLRDTKVVDYISDVFSGEY